ncbi:MAG: VOC family protein [Betaproteobacteria bacterium]|nr:VOC family protein [Betaproteobacteria bacterium]
MKRFHVHVAVQDLAASTQFYSTLFGMPPSVQKSDYAKWMLDDPRVNFAISERTGAAGLNHLGFQAETDAELEGIHANLKKAGTDIVAEKGANCCYAKSDKYWVQDPSGIPWESFRSLDSIPFYGEHSHKGALGAANDGDSDGVDAACGGTACCPTTMKAGKPEPKPACCNG